MEWSGAEYFTAILHHSTTHSTHSTAILLHSTLILLPILLIPLPFYFIQRFFCCPLRSLEWSGV